MNESLNAKIEAMKPKFVKSVDSKCTTIVNGSNRSMTAYADGVNVLEVGAAFAYKTNAGSVKYIARTKPVDAGYVRRHHWKYIPFLIIDSNLKVLAAYNMWLNNKIMKDMTNTSFEQGLTNAIHALDVASGYAVKDIRALDVGIPVLDPKTSNPVCAYAYAILDKTK